MGIISFGGMHILSNLHTYQMIDSIVHNDFAHYLEKDALCIILLLSI
jgi:hypothetical protein